MNIKKYSVSPDNIGKKLRFLFLLRRDVNMESWRMDEWNDRKTKHLRDFISNF